MKPSKTTTTLLIVLTSLVVVVFVPRFLKREQPIDSHQLQQVVDLGKLDPRLRAIYLADQIKDPVQRCLTYPSVKGIQRDTESIKSYCKAIADKWDFVELTKMLEDSQFEKVEELIELSMSNYLKTGIGESLPYRFFSLFNLQSDWNIRIANEWLSVRPDSSAALVAKAITIENQAGSIQKGRPMSKLTNEEKNEFKELIKQENQLLEKVISLDKTFLPAILNRLTNTLYESDESAHHYYDLGLEIDPNSFYLRNSYLHRLLPQWHGSFEEMEAFEREAMTLVDQNSRLIFLQIDRASELARLEWVKGNSQKALEIYDAALNETDSTAMWKYSAAVYSDMGDQLSEFERLSQATKYGGYDPYLEYKRANLLIKFSEFTWAEELVLRSMDLYPNYKYFYSLLGWLYKKEMRFEDSLAMYKKALEVNPDDVNAHTEIAWIHTYRVRNLALAKPHIDAILEVDPENYHAWLYMADYLRDTGGDPLFNALENFLEYVDRSDADMQQSITAIENFMATHSDTTE